MREINNIKYYDLSEITEIFLSGETKDTIRNHLEAGAFEGKIIGKAWYVTKENIEDFIEKKKKTKVHFSDIQEIDLTKIDLRGKILDIGGGGEGTIGQLKGSNVVSIDFKKSELEEAVKAGDKKSLKIIMDAMDLKFLDNTFDTVIAFFSIMYIPKSNHKKVFKEIYRVLGKEGELVLWDLRITNKIRNKELYVFLTKIRIKNKQIISGYGTYWNRKQDINYFIELAESVGFKTIKQRLEEDYFFLRLQKK